jgi:hypothetical protein
MERKRLCQSVAWLAVGVSAVGLVNSAAAQETLGRNKSPAQTFASDCAVCHKSPQGLAKSAGGLFGVEGFLREHYTSSKESAAALANYLRAQDSGPAGARAKRAAKGDQPRPNDQKKAGPKPAEVKGAERKPSGAPGDAKPSDGRPSDGRPADIMAPERRSVEPRANTPAAGEARPADGAGE